MVGAASSCPEGSSSLALLVDAVSVAELSMNDAVPAAASQTAATRARGRYAKLSECDRSRLVSLCIVRGEPVAAAIRGTGIKYQTACSFLRKFQKTGVETQGQRGGRRYIKITAPIEATILNAIEDDCTATLKTISSLVHQQHDVSLSEKSVARLLEKRDITLKVAHQVPLSRNTSTTIEGRFAFVEMMDGVDAPPVSSIVYIDETGFNLHLRRRYGRSLAGSRATVPVVNSRGTNISVAAAMSVDGLLKYKCRIGAFNGNAFGDYLDELFVAMRERDMEKCWIVMDNVRFHHSAHVQDKIHAAGHVLKFLPPYSPMLNPIELLFSKWKSAIRRTGFLSDRDTLLTRIDEAAQTISASDCAGWTHEATRFYALCRNRQPIV
jgi:transposase